MKRQIIAIILTAALITIPLAGCGKNNQESSNTENASSEEATEDGDTSDEPATDIMAEGDHDDSEKDNSVDGDIKTATDADRGSLDAVSGTYSIEVDGKTVEGTSYVFDNGQLYILKGGSYEMGSGKITMEYSGNSSAEYEITETDNGFNLMSEGILIPLVYAEGTDGLTGSEAFDGIYLMGDVGYKFSGDGSLTVIEKSTYTTEGTTISFGGNTEDWEAKDGKLVLSNNGTVVMTLVPSK